MPRSVFQKSTYSQSSAELLQGLHNLSVANHILQDPVLTELGEAQCKTLSTNFPNQENVSAIIASPLRRTLYTALLAFKPALDAKPDLKVIALPELQETSDVPCDTGSNLKVLHDEFEEKGLRVDLGLVDEEWNNKRNGTKWEPSHEVIMARGAEARKWLSDKFRDIDGDIILVSHGGFLHYFTEDWEDSGVYNGKLLSCFIKDHPSKLGYWHNVSFLVNLAHLTSPFYDHSRHRLGQHRIPFI